MATKYSGKIVTLMRDNIDTDQIIPKNYLKSVEKTGFGDFAFAEWRYDDEGQPISDFIFNQENAKECSVFVTGDNFGCGSSREHAAWALQELGLHVIVAGSYSDIFFNNWLNCGHWAVLATADVRAKLSETQEIVEVDIERRLITCGTESFPIELVTQSFEQMQRDGDFISETEQYLTQIQAYEQLMKI
ncbi:MAG: 3-isopropylmalate dehydratase small subunit [Mycoplasmatales bacterium]